MQKAIILDLDGTLADTSHRHNLFTGGYEIDWSLVDKMSLQDPPHAWCKNMAIQYSKAGYMILIVTARPKSSLYVTEQWLEKNLKSCGVEYRLYIRPENDVRPDFEYKREVYFQDIRSRFDVEFAVDDRDTVVSMWNQIGLAGLKFGNVVDSGVNYFQK